MPRSMEQPNNSNGAGQITLYVVVGVWSLSLITVGAVVAIATLRPSDNLIAVIAPITAFVGVAITGLLGFVLKLVASLRNEIRETHNMVNSRMDELLAASNSSSEKTGHAAGVEQERSDQRDREDNR